MCVVVTITQEVDRKGKECYNNRKRKAIQKEDEKTEVRI